MQGNTILQTNNISLQILPSNQIYTAHIQDPVTEPFIQSSDSEIKTLKKQKTFCSLRLALVHVVLVVNQ
jgi:hypothetical protein